MVSEDASHAACSQTAVLFPKYLQIQITILSFFKYLKIQITIQSFFKYLFPNLNVCDKPQRKLQFWRAQKNKLPKAWKMRQPGKLWG